jgi:hypothetical protein
VAEGGELIEQRIRTEPERFAAVLGKRPRARILIEASTDSEWVARCLVAEVADAVPAVDGGALLIPMGRGLARPADPVDAGEPRGPNIGAGAPGSRRSARDPERVLERVHDQAGHKVRVDRAAKLRLARGRALT